MRRDQRQAWLREMARARRCEAAGESLQAFRHLERAHIIGQRSTWAHTLSHWAMLKSGWRRRDLRETLGQLFRIPAAVTKSRIWVPVGNTGGAKVSAFRSMPVPADLKRYTD